MRYVQKINKPTGPLYYFRSPSGRRTALPDPSSAGFAAIYQACISEADAYISKRRIIREEARKLSSAEVERAEYFRKMALRLANRCRHKGIPFDLDADHLVELYERQRGRCALSRMPFSMGRSDRGQRLLPFSPSADRIVGRVGYIRGNVRLVTAMANFARNEFSDQEFLIMCQSAITGRKAGD